MEGEGGVGVVEVADAHVVDGLGVVQLKDVRVVREPSLVPIVDAIEIGGVIEAFVAGGNSAQVSGFKHIEG